MSTLRFLLLADTHLGFDLPRRPRSTRRRRGPDFFANTERALAPARAGEVDIVIHGGDLLFRSKVSAGLVADALAPFREVADLGVPVFIVPGNHERSHIPYPLLAVHPHLHIFDRPRTYRLEVKGTQVALSGFPYVSDVGLVFERVLDKSGYAPAGAPINLVCMHQSVEGAKVGPSDYTFKPGSDVVSARQVPAGCAAVLTGHIHRAQVLRRGLDRRPMRAPVIYPGSVERTSFAERDDDKGYVLLDLEGNEEGGRVTSHRFVNLEARPMVLLEVPVSGMDADRLEAHLKSALEQVDPNAVVQVRPVGEVVNESLRTVFGAERLRALAPSTMNIEVAGSFFGKKARRPGGRGG